MNPRFLKIAERLPSLCKALRAALPVRCDAGRKALPARGVYLLSEGRKHLYVGRSNNITRRLRLHRAGDQNQASFAFRLARETTGKTKAAYTKAGSRKALMLDPTFAKAFLDGKQRIAAMDVRVVSEDEPLCQALLEIYAAVALRTPYNDFNTY